MILLVTAAERARECGDALQLATDQPTQCATTLSDALSLLRSNEYMAVVLDQCLLDADPEQSELITLHLDSAMPISVNCALSGVDRVVREVLVALRRREIEVSSSLRLVEAELRSGLRDPLTAVILNCDLLLEMSGLPQIVRERIALIEEKAREIGSRLELNQKAVVPA